MIAFLLNVLLLVVTCLLLVFSLYSSKLMVVSFSSKHDLLICKWFIVYNVHGVLSTIYWLASMFSITFRAF